MTGLVCEEVVVRSHLGPFRCALILALAMFGMSCEGRKSPPPPAPAPSRPQPPGVGPAGQLGAEVPSPRQLAPGEPKDVYRTFVPGLLVRTRFAPPADKSARTAIEIWDAMVAPGKASETARLPGAAIVEVRSGTGVLSVAGKPQELRTGATASVDDGAEFRVTSSDKDAPLMLRVTLIRAGQP